MSASSRATRMSVLSSILRDTPRAVTVVYAISRPSEDHAGFQPWFVSRRGDCPAESHESARSLTSEQSSTARPLVLGAEHVHRDLRRIGMCRNLMCEEILGRLFALHTPRQRHDDRFVDALPSHLLDDLGQ